MSININANMSLGSAQFLDSRQSVATLDELLNLNTNIIPNGFECYVQDLDCKYKYHEDYNESGTGNWKLISVGEATESDIIVAHTPDEANELQKKVNRNKLMFYMGNTKSSYVHGELYYLHWNAITLKKFYTKGGGILEIDYDVLEQKYASYSQTITFKAEYKQDTTNVMNRWFCEYSGGSGSRLDVVGVNISNGSETLGDVIEFTYNSASKNSDNYTWKPLFVKPQRTFEKNWWLVNKIATYGGGYDDEFINGHRYQFTTDININATASGNIVVSLDEEQYKNYFGLHSKSSLTYNADTGCFEYRYGMIHYEDNRFTIEYLNKAGITWTGEIADGDTITITCTMSDDINDYYWKDLEDAVEGGSGNIVTLTQSEYDALTDDEKMDGREYRTYDTGHIYKLGIEYGKDACFTSLSQLGLTADATVEDVVNALKNGESFLAPVNTFTNYETIFPNKVPNDQWNKIHIIKGTSLASSHIRCFSPSGTSEYLANINNTNIVSWNDVSGTYIDISDAVIEKLGNEILKYPVGKYRINSTATGNKFIDLPSDAETKCGLIEINGTAVGKSPFTDTWVYRMYKFECLTGTSSYIRRLNSGATAGQIELDTGWCKEGQAKKEEDSYIPNVYDRNANGDMPVVPFDRLANCIAVRSNRGLVSTTETEATYNEDYVGGYVFIGANDILVKDKEMFNKIKVLVHIPGVLRIGIVNEKIYEANPRYSTCLVKWLVADFVAFTGMKEYDIADTVLEEGQSIFLECRTGVSSWYLNTGEATQVGAITYPANSCTTGLRVADKLDSTTNNILFKSQKVNSSSCLTSFGNNMYSIGGNIRGNFRERAYNSGANSSKKSDENFEYFGGLNVGLYRRTKYSDTRVCKCVENAMNNSWVGDDNVTKIYASLGQERIVGKSVYAIKLDVRIPGNLTIYHLKGKSLDTVQVIDKYTHYVRAIGLQTIHLPFDIKINSTDEYIGFGGFHCKSTSDNIVKHSCQWQYLDISQATWMTTVDNNSKKFYSIGLSNTDYPEKFTSFETNNNYVNIELICRGEKRSPLEDKYISFTGDSITTYTGFCTTKNGYPEGNPAGDNAVYYPASGKVVNNVDATWWGILARDNRMKILRNDAWSGSRVSSSEGSTDTKCLCGEKRRYYLRNGYNFATNSTYPFGRPEIIVSMIGTNDLSGNVELGSEMFRGVMGAEEEYKTILSAFSLFCRRIHDQEGNGGAKIVHFLIPRGSDYGYANASGVTIADLSLHFERIAKAWGQYFIPLSYFNGIKPNAPKRWSCPTGSMFKNTSGIEFPSADGLHPNAMGMEAIADGVHRFLCSIM